MALRSSALGDPPRTFGKAVSDRATSGGLTLQSTITPACGGNPRNPNHIAGQQNLNEVFAPPLFRTARKWILQWRNVRVVVLLRGCAASAGHLAVARALRAGASGGGSRSTLRKRLGPRSPSDTETP